MELLALNDQLFNMLCEQLSGESIILLDTLDTVSSWNNGAERLYQINEKEIVGHPVTIPFKRF